MTLTGWTAARWRRWPSPPAAWTPSGWCCSWGPEPCDVYAALAGTGTFTPVKEVNLLASDPLVLGAGGTSLTASHTTGTWQAETAFGLADGTAGSSFQASGGGFSRLFSRPGYQDGVPGASAPIWAALIALADQYAGRHLGFVNPAIYQIARGPSYHQAFHDITTGNNTVEFSPKTIAGYRAVPGWDPVTGWGSPDAQVLVPLLARYADA